jgi:hypothetical protein
MTYKYLRNYLKRQGISYRQYLATEHWQTLKRRFRKSKLVKNRCYCCGADDKPLQIHHKTYRQIGKEKVSDLVELCGDCHQEVHVLSKSRQASQFRLTQVHKRLRKRKQ